MPEAGGRLNQAAIVLEVMDLIDRVVDQISEYKQAEYERKNGR